MIASNAKGRWLDPFDEGHAWSAVLHPDIPVATDGEGVEDFDVRNELVPRLLAGKPVLRADLPPIEAYPELSE
ncbi:MAG TPA: hypothetical protein VFO79_11230 [Xanthomonadales bacterium]|nr:hypothetical protein [Xanthomonadales bacterium]